MRKEKSIKILIYSLVNYFWNAGAGFYKLIFYNFKADGFYKHLDVECATIIVNINIVQK